MPGLVPTVDDERAGLLGYLAQQRHVLRLAAHGLTEEQARQAPTASVLTASVLTVGGLIKHVTAVERFWIGLVSGRAASARPRDEAEYEDNFRLGETETLRSVLEQYDAAAAATDAALASIDDLGRPVPVPPGVPWFPDDVEAWSVRWVLLHLITETARHAGHADIVREMIDGATAFPLMAAAEGWSVPWMRAWEPATGQGG